MILHGVSSHARPHLSRDTGVAARRLPAVVNKAAASTSVQQGFLFVHFVVFEGDG